MKLRDIVLHVVMNPRHREIYMENKLKAWAKDGAVILKKTQEMVLVGEEEHLFKTERFLEMGGIQSLTIDRVEGYVPAHLERQVNARLRSKNV